MSTTLQKPKTTASILDGGDIKKLCTDCGKAVTVPGWLAGFARRGILCDRCSDIRAEQASRELAERSADIRAERWKQICPKDFLDTEPHRLPHPHQLQLVLQWQYGPQGLLLHGLTGKGKSRCAWVLLKREWQAGRSIACLNSASGLKYGALFGDSSQKALEWVERKVCADILLLDDVFKSKLTDSFEAALFTVISQRTERQLPIIVTSNDVASSLSDRLTADRGDAMLRRLKEFCRVVTFPK